MGCNLFFFLYKTVIAEYKKCWSNSLKKLPHNQCVTAAKVEEIFLRIIWQLCIVKICCIRLQTVRDAIIAEKTC